MAARRRRVLFELAAKSLLNRRLTAGLTVLSVAVSVALLIGVDRIRTETRAGFTNTITGADLIVGARGGPLNLLLYSVFRIGDATNGIRWTSYQEIAARPEVAWTIPLSLGDSHRGYRVLGTTGAYFDHYRHGRDRGLAFVAGTGFSDIQDAVLGADAATTLGYAVGDRIVVSHGIGEVSFQHHDESPFTVTGILGRTGTPVDRTVHVTLAAVDVIHTARGPTAASGPIAITACIVGLKSRPLLLGLQRFVNEYTGEPLMAIIPGVALQQLWQLIGVAEAALLGISVLVVLAGLIGMLTTLLTSLTERRREMAVLRAVGAGPGLVFGLLVAEAVMLAAVASVLGVATVHLGMLAGRSVLLDQFGLDLAAGVPGLFDIGVVTAVTLASAVIAILPAWRVYRFSLADGLTMRI